MPNVQADDNYCTLSRWGSPQQDVLVDNNCCTAMLWESLLPAQHNPWLDVQAFHSCCRLAHSGTRLRCVLASCSSGIMAPLDMLQQYALNLHNCYTLLHWGNREQSALCACSCYTILKLHPCPKKHRIKRLKSSLHTESNAHNEKPSNAH